uniref:Ion transport domain-containing protein n=1 Tax=Eutreptiella gymnastica TaxID=73025 RepID=A0A7S1IVH8_9EUGL|mmetsp:Transcript_46494/g.83112  ORF Transcript_46494/g.83112 Transcript_46494/m.83112 type:complete len:1986 (+) Transcript_46494:162-6119(+)
MENGQLSAASNDVAGQRGAPHLTVSVGDDAYTLNVLTPRTLADQRYPQTAWRKKFRLRIVRHKYFDRLVVGLILLNCLALALDDPTSKTEVTKLQNVVNMSEYFFTGAFTLELICNIIALGLKGYVSDPWNILDAVIVLGGITTLTIDLALPNVEVVGISGLRAFRVLRPLRAIAGIPEIRIIVNSLLGSFKMLLDAMSLYLLLMLMFGIMAIQLWKGRLLYRCVDSEGGVMNESQVCNPTESDNGYLELQGYQCPWGYTCSIVENPNYGKTSFDNIGIALLTLFTMVTTEWWTVVMYDVQNGISGWYWPYFVLLMLLGAFFVINLCLVIINDAFEKNVQAERDRKEELEQEQQRKPVENVPQKKQSLWRRMMDNVKAFCQPDDDRQLDAASGAQNRSCLVKMRLRMQRILRGSKWNFCITSVIIINTLILSLDHYPMDSWFADILYYGNIVCTYVFTFESFFKIVALGVRMFIISPANLFDLGVVIVSWIDIFFENAPGVTVLRTFRLLRLFKLARSFPSLQRWLNIVIESAVEASWLTVLLLLVLFIYALLGRQFFAGKLCCLDGDGAPWDRDSPECNVPGCPGVPRMNFDSLFWSLISVFQILSGEDWNALMYDGMRGVGDLSALFYVSCFIIGNYLVLNLFIAVLLNNQAITEHEEPEEAPQPMGSILAKNRTKQKWLRCLPCCGKKYKRSGSEILTSQQKKAWMHFVAHLSEQVPTDKNAKRGEQLTAFTQEMTKQLEKQMSEIIYTDKEDAPKPVPKPVSPTSPKPKPEEANGAPAGGVARGGLRKPGMGHGSPRSPATSPISSPKNRTQTPLALADGLEAPKDINTLKSLAIEHAVKQFLASMGRGSGAEQETKTNASRDRWRAFINAVDRAKKHPLSHAPQLWISDAERELMREVNTGIWQAMAVSDSPEKEEGEIGGVLANQVHVSLFTRVRRSLRKVITNHYFEYVVILLIVISSVALAMENPFMAPDSPLAVTLASINLVLSLLFFGEMCIKILAMGFVLEKGTYLRDGWNVLDFIIVTTSMAALISGQSSLQLLKMIRVLRPLRFINRSPGLKLVVDALISSIPPLGNVMLISMFFWLIFSILGTQFFMGKFYSCVPHPDIGDDGKTDYGSLDREQCVLAGGHWLNQEANFDNVLRSCLTLFEVATLEGWVDVMHNGVAAVGIGQAPVADGNPVMALYFVIFIVVGSFFILNLCIGVLIDNYYRMRNATNGLDANLTAEQREWITMQKVMMASFKGQLRRAVMPEEGSVRYKVWQFVEWKWFDNMILSVIILNICIMASEHYGQTDLWSDITATVNQVFGFIYLLECILKIVGYGWSGYIRDSWNKFDFCIVVFGTSGMIVNFISAGDIGIGTLFRVARLGRILRVLKMKKGIRTLVRTLVLSVPSLANVGGLLFLLYFLYALLGVKLFGGVRRGENLNQDANFEDMPHAMLLMVRMSTGEAWNSIMADCMVQEPFCSEQFADCGVPTAPIFFVSFVLLGMFILLNLFIAVILDNFMEVSEEEDLGVHDAIQNFCRVWGKFDPRRRLHMPTQKIPEFLVMIGPPFGFPSDMQLQEVLHQCACVNMIVDRQKVSFQNLLVGLAEHRFGVSLPADQVKKLEQQWVDLFSKAQSNSFPMVHESADVAEGAATTIQSAWRGRLERRRMKVKLQSCGSSGMVATVAVKSRRSSNKSSMNESWAVAKPETGAGSIQFREFLPVQRSSSSLQLPQASVIAMPASDLNMSLPAKDPQTWARSPANQYKDALKLDLNQIPPGQVPLSPRAQFSGQPQPQPFSALGNIRPGGPSAESQPSSTTPSHHYTTKFYCTNNSSITINNIATYNININSYQYARPSPFPSFQRPTSSNKYPRSKSEAESYKYYKDYTPGVFNSHTSPSSSNSAEETKAYPTEPEPSQEPSPSIMLPAGLLGSSDHMTLFEHPVRPGFTTQTTMTVITRQTQDPTLDPFSFTSSSQRRPTNPSIPRPIPVGLVPPTPPI